MTTIQVHRVRAQNFSTAHENKIHSDDIAKKFGFQGALVPGVAIYGHLTYPLVNELGADWFSGWSAEVRLRKPAYHDDQLSLELHKTRDGYSVTCDARGERLAELHSQRLDKTVPNAPAALNNAVQKSAGRVDMTWDTVVPEQPFIPWGWIADAETNQTHCEQILDPLPIYQEYVHPHWLLSQANSVLTREYVMPAWIHVGSSTRHLLPVRVGDELTIRAVPLEKWERKGHHFVRAYIAYERAGQITTEIEHTAIFRVAQ